MKTRLLASLLIALCLLIGSSPQRSVAADKNADRGIVAAEFDDRDLHAYRSFRAYGQRFTHLLPRWLHLAASGRQLDKETDRDIVEDAKKLGLTVIPILDNLDASGPRPDLMRTVLTDPTRRGNRILAVSRVLAENNLGGVDVQFLGVETEDYADVATFLRELKEALQPSGRIVILSAYVAGKHAVPTDRLIELAPSVDYVRALVYERFGADIPRGPAASN